MKYDILKKYWNLNATEILSLPRSTASCFRVNAIENSYFLKIFQPSYPTDRAILEYNICKQLNMNAIPVSEIVVTSAGQPHALYENRIIQLQKYVDGVSPKNYSMNPTLLCEASEYLGRIHASLNDQQLPCLFDINWLKKYEESAYVAFYQETYRMAEKTNMDDESRRKIFDDLAFLTAFAKQMNALALYFEGITYTASHGDYIPCQLICKNDHVLKIVDFANAHSVPVGLELMRFYFLGSVDTRDPYDFRIVPFSEYLQSYMKYFPLTTLDLMHMPYIYLYYMGRNRFVYREYLKTGDKNAFDESSRRVDVIRFLLENASAISMCLKDLYPM